MTRLNTMYMQIKYINLLTECGSLSALTMYVAKGRQLVQKRVCAVGMIKYWFLYLCVHYTIGLMC